MNIRNEIFFSSYNNQKWYISSMRKKKSVCTTKISQSLLVGSCDLSVLSTMLSNARWKTSWKLLTKWIVSPSFNGSGSWSYLALRISHNSKMGRKKKWEFFVLRFVYFGKQNVCDVTPFCSHQLLFDSSNRKYLSCQRNLACHSQVWSFYFFFRRICKQKEKFIKMLLNRSRDR